MQTKLWQTVMGCVVGGALLAATFGGMSCGSSYSGGGTAGSYAGNSGNGRGGNGAGGMGGNANQSVYNMQLTGAQEIPANTSAASATVMVTLDLTTGAVTVTGHFQNLSSMATVAHIHGPAAVGMTANVLVPLTVTAATSGTVSGSGMMSSMQMNDMLSGMTYVNIHSMTYPDGEIRAQVIP